MSYTSVEERMDKLETLFSQFVSELRTINQRSEERNRQAEERSQRAEERSQRAEERMTRFEADSRQFKRNMDKKWGDLANKMGTIIEDIVAPNLPRLAMEHFGIKSVDDFFTRRLRRQPGNRNKEQEFDAVLVGADTVVLAEAKSTPSAAHVEALAQKRDEFFDFFPEYRGKRLVTILGSWAMDDRIVVLLTGQGIFAMRMGDDTMELVNVAAVQGQSGHQAVQSIKAGGASQKPG